MLLWCIVIVVVVVVVVFIFLRLYYRFCVLIFGENVDKTIRLEGKNLSK